MDDVHRMAQVLPWPSHSLHRRLFGLWMGSHYIEIVNKDPHDISRDAAASLPAHRFMYTPSTGKDSHVAIHPSTSVKKLFAQQIFSTFLSKMLNLITEINGPAERIIYRGRLQRLRHSRISPLVDIVSETGLGTRQEMQMRRFYSLPYCVIPGPSPLRGIFLPYSVDTEYSGYYLIILVQFSLVILGIINFYRQPTIIREPAWRIFVLNVPLESIVLIISGILLLHIS